MIQKRAARMIRHPPGNPNTSNVVIDISLSMSTAQWPKSERKSFRVMPFSRRVRASLGRSQIPTCRKVSEKIWKFSLERKSRRSSLKWLNRSCWGSPTSPQVPWSSTLTIKISCSNKSRKSMTKSSEKNLKRIKCCLNWMTLIMKINLAKLV